MSVIHLNQIKAQIDKLFRGKIDLSDVVSDKADPKLIENFLLTRALAAYPIHYLAQASVEDSAASVTDSADAANRIVFSASASRKALPEYLPNGAGRPPEMHRHNLGTGSG